MTQKHVCGPGRDAEFFRDLAAVFAKHSNVSGRYAVRCLHREKEVLKVDFAEQVGLSRVEGDRIVTEFRNRDEVESGFDPEDLPVCCEWAGDAPHMVCVQLCEL